jgi:hypothetical protein
MQLGQIHLITVCFQQIPSTQALRGEKFLGVEFAILPLKRSNACEEAMGRLFFEQGTWYTNNWILLNLYKLFFKHSQSQHPAKKNTTGQILKRCEF